MQCERKIEEEVLPVLPNIISNDLLRAIKGFVHNKYLLDKLVREEGGFCFAGELSGDGMGPQEATSFYRAIFPFVPVWRENGERFSALVPTCQTLGCSWRWRNRNLTPEARKKCLSLFTDPERGSFTGNSVERADFMWVEKLGLVLPNEGKNRVDFLREEQIEMIPARVSAYDYPDASRIVLYRVKLHEKYEYWAVLDGRWVERLNHPFWATPVLYAYGVPKDQQWPLTFPPQWEVLEGFNSPSGNPDFLNEDIVDLQRITLVNADRQEVLPCSQMDLRVTQLRSKSIVWWWIGSFFASLICISLMPHTWFVNLGIFAGFILGTTLGMGLFYFLPLLRTTRAILKQEWLGTRISHRQESRH